MKRELSFTPVDLRTWNRGEVFVYFSQMAPTGYSLTVKVDVTRMKAALDEAGLKFFPAYVWLVTKVLNRQQAFRMAEKDGQTGFYSHLTPLYATFHEQDKTFSLMWTEYDEDFGAFYEGYLFNQQTYGANQGILARKDTLPPPNAYTVSCVPWISCAFCRAQLQQALLLSVCGGGQVCVRKWPADAAPVHYLSPRRNGRLSCQPVSGTAAGGGGCVCTVYRPGAG